MMKRKTAWLAIAVLLAVTLFVVFLPLDPVRVSSPNAPNKVVCPQPQPTNGTLVGCIYGGVTSNGYASLAYCYLGSGALWINGTYYAMTSPRASNAFQISSFCPTIPDGIP